MLEYRRVNSLIFIGLLTILDPSFTFSRDFYSFYRFLSLLFYGELLISEGIFCKACLIFISIKAISRTGSLISKVNKWISSGKTPLGSIY